MLIKTTVMLMQFCKCQVTNASDFNIFTDKLHEASHPLVDKKAIDIFGSLCADWKLYLIHWLLSWIQDYIIICSPYRGRWRELTTFTITLTE